MMMVMVMIITSTQVINAPSVTGYIHIIAFCSPLPTYICIYGIKSSHTLCTKAPCLLKCTTTCYLILTVQYYDGMIVLVWSSLLPLKKCTYIIMLENVEHTHDQLTIANLNEMTGCMTVGIPQSSSLGIPAIIYVYIICIYQRFKLTGGGGS